VAISPTQNSLKKIKTDGWSLAQIVEHWNPFGKGGGNRKDLFGIIDILALNDKGDVLAVQTTSKNNMNARIKKMESDEHFYALSSMRQASWQIEVHGWYKEGNRWKVKIADLS